jgi:hypothetical protein
MFDLKPISQDSVPGALAKAERYRLLNEPRQAESICRDILHVDRENQQALTTMLLALTDQFGKGLRVSVSHAQELLPRLESEYDRTYYDGVIHERWAKAQLQQGAPGHVVYDWITKAMALYERAGSLAETGNEDATLRWNTCVRIIKRNSGVRPRPEDVQEAMFQDDIPV